MRRYRIQNNAQMTSTQSLSDELNTAQDRSDIGWRWGIDAQQPSEATSYAQTRGLAVGTTISHIEKLKGLHSDNIHHKMSNF